MLKRTITGLIIVLVCAGFIALRSVSTFFFDVLAFAIIYGSILEMSMALKLYNKKASLLLTFIFPLALFAIFAFIPNSILKGKELVFVVLTLLGLFAVSMVKELIVNAIKRNGVTAKFTAYQGVEHNSWDLTYSRDDVYEWLLGFSF